MRLPMLLIALLAAGCEAPAILAIDDTRPGVTGARATGQFPNIQEAPRRAARQLDAGTYADIAAELNAEASEAARLPRVDGQAADARARRLVREAEAAERRRRRRIETQGRVAPQSVEYDVIFKRRQADS